MPLAASTTISLLLYAVNRQASINAYQISDQLDRMLIRELPLLRRIQSNGYILSFTVLRFI